MMEAEVSWMRLQEWLGRVRQVSLPRGRPFRASFDQTYGEIVVEPSETGIPRRIRRRTWGEFVDRFNQVEVSGRDPLRPGHYVRTTHNSSYLVALTIAAVLNEARPRRR